VLFVVSRIEDAPRELDGAADEITMNFPWGSLLRGLVFADASVLAPLARIARPGANIDVLLSVGERDRSSGVGPHDSDAFGGRCAAFASAGLTVERNSVAALSAHAHTTWGKRLAATRHVRIIRLRRAGDNAGSGGSEQ